MKKLTLKEITLISDFWFDNQDPNTDGNEVVLPFQDYSTAMRLVEKIERLYATEKQWGVVFDIYTTHVCARYCTHEGVSKFHSGFIGTCLQSPEKVKFATKLEAIYYCVLSFIRWYNTQKQKDL